MPTSVPTAAAAAPEATGDRGAPPLQEMQNQLTALGLRPEEATAYLHLLARGPTRATDLAGVLGMSRQRVYRLTDQLARHGFIAMATGRPRRFAAASPETLLAQLRSRVDLQARLLQQLEPNLVTRLVALQSPPAEAANAQVRIIRGRWDIIAQSHRMYEAAKRSVDTIFTHAAGMPVLEATGGLVILGQRALAGVEVRMVVRGALPVALPPLVQARATSGPEGMISLVTDGAESLIVLMSEPGRPGTGEVPLALWTDAPDFATLQRALFEALWANARPAPAYVGATARPGPRPR
ncbi:MAG: TrmB family transcriptional regulator [Thermoplasmatota archaeon]